METSPSLPDIVLRLARREIASGLAPAADPLAPSPWDAAHLLQAHNAHETTVDEPPESYDAPTDAHSSATHEAQINPVAINSVDDLSLTQPAATPAPVPLSATSTYNEAQNPHASEEALSPSLSSTLYPPFSTSTPWPDFETSDAPQPFSTRQDAELQIANEGPGASPSSIFHPPSSATAAGLPNNQQPASAGDSRSDRLSESAADQARQLEQLSRDLDSSLTRLFTTQLETLDHLRQRLDDHERLWLEQQALRRAAVG